ncbi:hypothetical protein [Paenibacillus sp. NPDC058174]|uniref:hypothetical protein n=1 Tax=Paenibacillus sp. NPDC058174 TaxID=3346366 RepID=UPI0036DBC2DD
MPKKLGMHMPSGKKLVGNAVAGEVLTGKTFSNATGNDKVGTMPDRAAMTLNPGTSDVAIPAGYHNGAGKVSKVTVDPSKVLSGTVIAGTAGTIPLRGNEEYAGWSRATLGPVPAMEARVHARVPLGAYLNDGANGSGYQGVFLDDPNFTSKNIAAGVNVLGLTGTFGKEIYVNRISSINRDISYGGAGAASTTPIVDTLFIGEDIIVAYTDGTIRRFDRNWGLQWSVRHYADTLKQVVVGADGWIYCAPNVLYSTRPVYRVNATTGALGISYPYAPISSGGPVAGLVYIHQYDILVLNSYMNMYVFNATTGAFQRYVSSAPSNYNVSIIRDVRFAVGGGQVIAAGRASGYDYVFKWPLAMNVNGEILMTAYNSTYDLFIAEVQSSAYDAAIYTSSGLTVFAGNTAQLNLGPVTSICGYANGGGFYIFTNDGRWHVVSTSGALLATYTLGNATFSPRMKADGRPYAVGYSVVNGTYTPMIMRQYYSII